MSKKLFFVFMILLIGIFFGEWVGAFAGGTGTAGDPYKISNCQELQSMQTNLNAHYILINNIDCSSTKTWNSLAGFQPIGPFFNGNFNGKGFTIDGLFINRPNSESVGLFISTTGNSKIINVKLIDVYVSGKNYVGAIAGENRGEIVDSSSAGYVFASGGYAGGLVGFNNDLTLQLIDKSGVISSSSASGSVIGQTFAIGGLIGKNFGGKVYSSSFSGDVRGSDRVGGLVGFNEGGLINTSFSLGIVYGFSSSTGGLVGYEDGNSIQNSFSNASVIGNIGVGGLVGYMNGNEINRVYSFGRVQGNSNVGGLVGHNDFSFSCAISFWDTQTSGQTTSAAGCGTGKTTSQMKQQSTFSGWDFTNIWEINNGVSYPYIKGKCPFASNVCLPPPPSGCECSGTSCHPTISGSKCDGCNYVGVQQGDSTCNGIDDDCDGRIDEDCTETYWANNALGSNKLINPPIIQKSIGDKIYLILDRPPPSLISNEWKYFEVWEKDGIFSSDDKVRGYLIGKPFISNTRYSAEWTITQQDIDNANDFLEGSNYEFYFKIMSGITALWTSDDLELKIVGVVPPLTCIPGESWEQNNIPWNDNTAPYSRKHFSPVVYNNKIWVLGGETIAGSQVRDVWTFDFNNEQWTQPINPFTNSPMQISYISKYSSVVYNDGSGEKIWILGGMGEFLDTTTMTTKYDITNQILTFDGSSLAPLNPNINVGWSPRIFHSSVVYNNKIWVLGGIRADSSYIRDVWSFDGSTWIQHANPPWNQRHSFGAVVYNNKIWVLGGQKWYSGKAVSSNEVWSFDGSTWTQYANAPWSGRYNFASVVSDNKIWILGGWSDEENTEFKEVWSFDGSTWTQHTEIPWTKRKYVTSVEHDNKIFLLGGQTGSSGSSLNKDMWISPPLSCFACKVQTAQWLNLAGTPITNAKINDGVKMNITTIGCADGTEVEFIVINSTNPTDIKAMDIKTTITNNQAQATWTATPIGTYYFTETSFQGQSLNSGDLNVSLTGGGFCGNNQIEGQELCDDGNLISGDGCFNCQIEISGECDNDGAKEDNNPNVPGEFCDGSDLGVETCLTQGFTGGALSCSNTCQFNINGCTPKVAFCGDGDVDIPNSAGFNEECDDGNLISGDGCFNCEWEIPLSCNNDNIVNHPPEFCDGTNLTGKVCSDFGYFGSLPFYKLGCTNCQFNQGTCHLCGNGDVDAGEECDGINLNGKACTNFGFTSGALSCKSDCIFDKSSCTGTQQPVCGDNIKEGTEECDDGNTQSGDGCSSTCKDEIDPNCGAVQTCAGYGINQGCCERAPKSFVRPDPPVNCNDAGTECECVWSSTGGPCAGTYKTNNGNCKYTSSQTGSCSTVDMIKLIWTGQKVGGYSGVCSDKESNIRCSALVAQLPLENWFSIIAIVVVIGTGYFIFLRKNNFKQKR